MCLKKIPNEVDADVRAHLELLVCVRVFRIKFLLNPNYNFSESGGRFFQKFIEIGVELPDYLYFCAIQP